MNRPPKLQDDRTGGSRSFNSSYQPCSQSRKMSIGITIDPFSKSKPEKKKRNEADMPVAEDAKLTQGNASVNGDILKVNVDVTTNLEKKLENSDKKKHPWVSPKSIYHAKRTMNLPVRSESPHRYIGEKETSATYSVQSLANKILDSKYNEHKGKNEVICEETKKKDGTVQEQVKDKVDAGMSHEKNTGCKTLKLKLWEILGTVSSPKKHCTNSQDLDVASKSLHPKLKGGTHSNAEGAAKQNSDTIESDTQKPTEKLRRPVTRSVTQKKAPRRQKTVKRRNSPTICYKDYQGNDIFSFKEGWPEASYDALNDDLPTSKRKKGTWQPHGSGKGECSVHKVNNAQTSKQSQKRGKALLSTEKSSSRGNVISFEPKNLDKEFFHTESRKMKAVTKDIDSLNLQKSTGQPEGLGHSYLKKKLLTDVSTCSPSFKINSPVRRSTLASPIIREVQEMDEHGHGEQITNTKGTQVFKETDISPRRPTTEMSTPVRRSSLASPTICKMQDVDEPCSGEKLFNTKGGQNWKIFLGKLKYSHADAGDKVDKDSEHSPIGSSSEEDGYGERITNTKVTQGFKETDISTRSPSTDMNTPVRRFSLASAIRKMQDVDEHCSAKKVSNTKGGQSWNRSVGNLKYPHADAGEEVDEDPEHSPIGSSSEEDSERSDCSLHERGYQHNQTVSPDIGTAEKRNSVSSLRKMFINQKGFGIDKRYASVSSKGDEARRKLMRHLEQSQDDGLTSAVALLDLALERLRGKVKSITQKKSTEILKYVADEISLQLQNAETQIQSDMEKVAEHGRAKRKRLETQFQDLQGQLAVTYERFRKEVNENIQDYKCTLEGSEAFKVELRGSMEKQRELHRKLLAQAEEAIGSKLSDAQSRIDTVHNLSRGKMAQLKNVMAEVVKDGVLG